MHRRREPCRLGAKNPSSRLRVRDSLTRVASGVQILENLPQRNRSIGSDVMSLTPHGRPAQAAS
jgi:hypothetical protein